jgi:hypothetical protein
VVEGAHEPFQGVYKFNRAAINICILVKGNPIISSVSGLHDLAVAAYRISYLRIDHKNIVDTLSKDGRIADRPAPLRHGPMGEKEISKEEKQSFHIIRISMTNIR